MNHLNFKTCIDACLAAVLAAKNCATECRDEPQRKMLEHCIRLDDSCVQTCFFTMEAMTYENQFVAQIAQLCAYACNACAEECEKHAHDHCQKCAEACRECAIECEKISKMS